MCTMNLVRHILTFYLHLGPVGANNPEAHKAHLILSRSLVPEYLGESGPTD